MKYKRFNEITFVAHQTEVHSEKLLKHALNSIKVLLQLKKLNSSDINFITF